MQTSMRYVWYEVSDKMQRIFVGAVCNAWKGRIRICHCGFLPASKDYMRIPIFFSFRHVYENKAYPEKKQKKKSSVI